MARLKMKHVNSQFQFYQTPTSALDAPPLAVRLRRHFLTSLKEDDEKSL